MGYNLTCHHNISEFSYATGWEGKEDGKACVTKPDNNFVWNNFLPNFNFLKTDLFIKDQKTLKLSDNHNKKCLSHTSVLPSSSSCLPQVA